MKYLLENLIYFGAAFLIVFLIYVLFINKRIRKNKINTLELNYLIRRFNLDIKKVNHKKIMWMVTFTNSFIISFTSVVTFNIESFLWRVLVGFVLLMILIYSIYEIEGRILKWKEIKK